ncbi:YfhO family protein [Mangrovibacterium diazotrophicum]|uniref:Membrane protein YfhO n=1 Tax=Mangrovibacterium diazotrophicum TaxID=1261403 RepID=A0A419WAY6_9BACT|nr:YfhO family protein [Mangrovibacterium diazotrophicum]RKD92584.1 membrane protein YfhO [Mangrovibacterium diazotrophicum]
MAKIKGNRNLFVTIGIILFFIVLSFVYYSPQLEGKKLLASDNVNFKGMAKEIGDYRAETGEEALWTNSMFGGMPAYLISTRYGGELLAKVQSAFLSVVPRPAGYLALGFICFFVMCLLLGVNAWIAMVGGLMYGMATYFFVLIESGHYTKVHTLMYMPLVVGGVISAFRNKPYWGALVTGLGLSWMLSANHPQMTYYAAIMVLIIGIAYLVDAIREKTVPAFLKSTGLLLVALILAVGTNFGRLATVYEYGKYSTRGKSELKVDEQNQTQGLDKDYILEYSYDFGEAMTAFIPRFKGGGMSEPLGENSEVYSFFEKNQGKAAAKKVTEALPLYWGSQPISAAPFYYGAVVFFLFVLGLFIVKGKDKWWILAVFIVSLLLSLGKNFGALSHFMIDYFPGYNKFRDVKNIIVIQHFAMVLMSVLAVRELFRNQTEKKELMKSLKYTWFILGGLTLLFVLVPGLAGDFRGPSDARFAQAGWPQQLLQALMDDRRSILRVDAFKAFVFVTLSAGVVWLYIQKKIKVSYAVALWALLVLVDLWPIDKKYMSNDSFVSKSKVEKPYTASKADQAILADTDPDFRVLNLTVSPFQDASTSYFHKSLGGYHGAKMERYQELFDHELYPEIRLLIGGFQQPNTLDSVLNSLSVINMLNTRYVIYDPNSEPLENPDALGNAWFVNDFKTVANANEEMDALKSFDASEEAIVDERFAEQLKDVKLGTGHNSQIRLEEYRPNYLKYSASVSGGTALAVFSEIYYPKGWDAFIDGKKVDYMRVNYVLRALAVPEGRHEIEFKFEPSSYFIGNKISLASSLILLLAAAGLIFMEWKKRAKHEEEASDKA